MLDMCIMGVNGVFLNFGFFVGIKKSILDFWDVSNFRDYVYIFVIKVWDMVSMVGD